MGHVIQCVPRICAQKMLANNECVIVFSQIDVSIHVHACIICTYTYIHIYVCIHICVIKTYRIVTQQGKMIYYTNSNRMDNATVLMFCTNNRYSGKKIDCQTEGHEIEKKERLLLMVILPKESPMHCSHHLPSPQLAR